VTTTYWKGEPAGPNAPPASEAMPVGFARLMPPGETGTAAAPDWTPEEFSELIDPEPLSATKNGRPGRKVMAQGSPKLGALLAATPETLDARLVCR
jgi:hypothetical protein